TNPELFELKKPKAPIPQFVNAFRKAGIGLRPEQILNGLTYKVIESPKRDQQTGEIIRDSEGNEIREAIILGVYDIPSEVFPKEYKDLAGEIPLIYAKQVKDGWLWMPERTNLVPLKIPAEAIGLYIGTMYDSAEETRRNLPLFNTVLIPNVGWALREPQYNTFKGINFVNNLIKTAKDLGVNRVIGGHLFYSPEYPSWVENYSSSEKEAEELIRKHVADFINSFPDIKTFIVANEVKSPWIKKDPIADRLGTYRFLEVAFGAVKETYPNKITILSDGANYFFSRPTLRAETEKDIEFIKYLKARNLIDAISIHGHINMNPYQPRPDPEEFKRVLQTYKNLGVDVYITELDVSLYDKSPDDPNRWLWQALVYQEIIKSYLEVESGNLIVFWGVQDNTSWLETNTSLGNKNADPLLFDDEGNAKISYYVILKTIFNQLLENK
ncbi:MAG: endo-1,4-beta-xylanase, partial [Thermoproteota archaeon]